MGNVPPVERDARYYLDEQVIFRVEDTLFCLPKALLVMHSQVFQDMFSLPQAPGAHPPPEGTSDSNPILLNQYKKEEFQSLLKVMIRTTTLSTQDWMSALKLAKSWQMEHIRTLAITALSQNPPTIPAAQRAAFARDYEISAWILPALRELARRKEAVTVEEGYFLGMDWMTKIAKVRESFVPAAGRQSNVQTSVSRPAIAAPATPASVSATGNVGIAPPNLAPPGSLFKFSQPFQPAPLVSTDEDPDPFNLRLIWSPDALICKVFELPG